MPKLCAYHLFLTAAIAGCLAGSAWAQSGPQQQDDDSLQVPRRDGFDRNSRGARNEAADAVRRAQARSGGRVLGAERVQFDGRDIMRVKVMDESGRVHYMDDDPFTRGQGHGDGAEREHMSRERPRGPNPRRP